MLEQSLKKRYVAKIFTSFIGFAIGLITTAIIPRGLGAKAYGDFSFLTNIFSQILPLLTLSTSFGFFTKLSQHQTDNKLVNFYIRFTILSFILLFAFVVIAQLTGLSKKLWIDQSIKYVYMAAIFAVLTWVAQITNLAVDAYGLTVSSEIAKIIQKLIGVVIILALFFMQKMNLSYFFFYNYVTLLFIIFAFIKIVKFNGINLYKDWKLNKNEIKKYSREFYEYSHPLLVFSVAGMATGIFDRWLLQKYGGSFQQGFFNLAFQIGAVCFVFTSAMSLLIMREFSIAFKKNDINEMSRLFRCYIPTLYSIAAFFGCFACLQSDKITYIFGGEQFAGASLPIAIMALYPIHQTYGQLSGSVFYATGQTKLYRNISLFYMLIGLPMVYFALAPTNRWGFNAGATGLAMKFFIANIIVVNIQLFFNTKYLKLNFIKYFAHQFICMFFLLGLAFISKICIDTFSFSGNNMLKSFIVSGILYSLLTGIILFLFPPIFGLHRNDIKLWLNIVSSKINKFNI